MADLHVCCKAQTRAIMKMKDPSEMDSATCGCCEDTLRIVKVNTESGFALDSTLLGCQLCRDT